MVRDVAQLGSAPDWGSGGRWFKSSHPDHFPQCFRLFGYLSKKDFGFAQQTAAQAPELIPLTRHHPTSPSELTELGELFNATDVIRNIKTLVL